MASARSEASAAISSATVSRWVRCSAEHARRVLRQQFGAASETPLVGVTEAVRAQVDRLDPVGRGPQLLHELADGGFQHGRGIEEGGGIPGIF